MPKFGNNMTELQERLGSIYAKLNQLEEQLELSQAELAVVKRDLHQSRETIGLQKNTIRSLEEKNKLVKIAEAVALSKEDKRTVKLKINEFIREIDKCIATLSD